LSNIHISLVIPKATTLDHPAKYETNVSSLVINKVSIGFPLGCVDLVGVWLEYRSARLFPANDDGYFVGNGQIIEFTTQTYITDPPYFIAIKGYNEDSVYQHRIWVNIDVDFISLVPHEFQLLPADNANFPHNRA
jgi:hypothetical protein